MTAATWWLVLLSAAALSLQLADAQQRPGATDGVPRYPTYNGARHNKERPTLGQGGSPYARIQVPHAASGGSNATDGLTGANRPSPRAITLALLSQPYFKARSETNTSYLLTALGQFVSHDITRGVSTSTANGGAAPIPIPPGDPFMSVFRDQELLAAASRRQLPYLRSNFTRVAPGAPREQLNDASAWLDASALYGQSEQTVKLLRAGTAGRLLDDGHRLLPYNVEPDVGGPKTTMKNLGERLPQTKLRLSGNANVNQNPMVATMVTIFMREHNRRAMLLESANPSWGDEQIFQEARKWVIAHFQRIATVDYLTALGINLPLYPGYNASLDPSIDAFFSTVAYRYGHSTIQDIVLRLDDAWAEHPKGHISLAFAMYNPDVAFDAGLEPLVRGLLVQAQGRVEASWALAIQSNFAGPSGINGTDLAAINIQRGRDHGIPDYNTCRRALGLPAAKSFADITPDTNVQAILQDLYKDVNNIDAYVGGLAEPHDGSSHVGLLFTRSIREQFGRLRNADWYFYENSANKLFNASEVEEIRKTSLRDLLARNTNISDLPANIWDAGGAMMCDASSSRQGSNIMDGGSSGRSGRNELRLASLMDGTARLDIAPSETEGWARVRYASATTNGWLGFGVARDSAAPMIGADMVVGRMIDGKPVVRRYHAIDHIPPIENAQDSQDGRLRVIKFEQTAGGALLEFERPMEGGSGDTDLPMPARSPVVLIVARGRGNDFDANAYHGTSNREIIGLPQGLYAGSSTLVMHTAARARRKAHGTLMAVNFIVVMPLGALAARQLRCHWLQNPRVRASLFYVHIATQVAGVAITTAGFVIATRWFGVPFVEVQYGHGKLGVAILVLVYSQLIVGFLRPAARAPTLRRQAWDLVHTTLGRASMLIGVANVALGVVIFSQSFSGNFPAWAGLCAAGLGAISLLQYVLDRQEKWAVLKQDAALAAQGSGGAGSGFKDAGGSGQLDSLDDATAAADAAHAQRLGLGGSNGIGSAGDGNNTRLTASVLRKHQADSSIASGEGGEGVGLAHPGFGADALRGAGPPHGMPGDDMAGHYAHDQQAPAAAANAYMPPPAAAECGYAGGMPAAAGGYAGGQPLPQQQYYAAGSADGGGGAGFLPQQQQGGAAFRPGTGSAHRGQLPTI